MKVLHIHSYLHGGGAETVFNITRANNLNQHNYSGYIQDDLNHCEQPDVIFYNYLQSPKITQLLNYIFSIRNYRALRDFLNSKEIQIIHLHGFIGALSPSILFAIKFLKKKKNFKVVQTMHDFNILCPNSLLFNFNKNVICERCLKSNLKLYGIIENCDRRGEIHSILKTFRSFISNKIAQHEQILDLIIVPSMLMKNKFIEAGIRISKLCMIRNPFDEVDDCNSYEKSNSICYFGRLSKEKNVEFLIDSFLLWKYRTKNNFTFLIIGEGDEESKLKTKVKNSQFPSSIKFFPFLSKTGIKELIKDTKYFTMSSRVFENAPMALLEAASLNILPIVPNLGGMRETVEEVMKCGVIYQAENSESWVMKMEELNNNYEKHINKLSKQKKELFDQFGLHAYYLNLYENYKKILDN